MHRAWKRISNTYERILLFFYRRRARFLIGAELLALAALIGLWYVRANPSSPAASALLSLIPGGDREKNSGQEKDFIKWVDFTVPEPALTKAFRYDVDTCQQPIHLNWIELLAYLSARYGGNFSNYKESDMDAAAQSLLSGASMEQLTADLTYYPYYLEAYTAVLGGLVGYYEIEIPASEAPPFALADAQIHESDPSAGLNPAASGEPYENSSTRAGEIPSDAANPSDTPGSGEEAGSKAGSTEEKTEENGAGKSKDEAGSSGENSVLPDKVWVTKYGLKGFLPIAKNFPYSDYDDFGVSRSYGYSRKHLGHDMMGQTGTPVIAVESGYVETLGWNQYGGWRIGIRSFDRKRYYYYAHLRKNYPYQSALSEGSIVTAGDVIGYMGRTGYSASENTNNIDQTHLHFGLQLIFDESQKEGDQEIWIDCYELMKFLKINRSEAAKVEGTKEWARVYHMKDPSVEEAKKQGEKSSQKSSKRSPGRSKSPQSPPFNRL